MKANEPNLRVWVITLALFFAALPAVAGELRGRVVVPSALGTSQGTEVVGKEGVVVLLYGPDQRLIEKVVTGRDGFYYVPPVPAGAYVIDVQWIRPKRVEVVIGGEWQDLPTITLE